MDENFNSVPKEINPLNVLQTRTIENWGVCLTQNVYEESWEATSKQQLVRRIESKMKEFDKNFVESLLEGSRQKSDHKVIMVSML